MRNNLNNLSGMFSPSQELERMIGSPATSITTRRQNIQTPSFFASPIATRGLFSPHSQSLPTLVDDESLSTNNKTEIFSNDDDKSSVRVVVRVRPLFDSETQNCIQVDAATKRSLQVLSNNPKEKLKTYTFDHVASPTTTQKDMFEYCGKPIVDSCLSGYNGTIFCYGQTGSGKTFTMGTSHNEDSMEDDLLSSFNHNLHLPTSAGLIPRVLSYVFSEIDKKRQRNDIKFVISCSFLEIYNERITDLLDSTPKLPLFNGGTVSKSLNLREDIKSGVYVEQLIHEDIVSPVDALSILKKGLSNRHVGSTSMNNQSSRSHSVFTIYIKSQEAAEGGTKTRTSRLNLIDLAGSERQSTSNTEGDRLKEACSINKSLSTLGKVIKDLVDVANGVSRHVQYRDSKLTFLLKDSLGGNSKTCVIANISPAINSLSESLSTITFAQRAKRIKNEAKINEETSGSITFLQEQIKLLRRQLTEANKRVSEVPQSPIPQLAMDENEKERYIMELQLQHVYLSTQSDEQEEKNSMLTHRIEELKKLASSKDRLLTTTRFLLRLRESKIARLTGKSVKNPKKDFVSGLDFDFDRPMSPQKFSKFNFENFTLNNEEQFLSIADSALQKALSPEQHPDVIQLKIENMELKEQLNSYESQFSKEYGTNKELFKELNSYIQSLELSIRHLTGEKEQLSLKIQEMEKTHRRNSSILQEQVTISENQTLLGEITKLEQMYEESLETIGSIKTELTNSQEKEKIAWSEFENIKQILEQTEAEKEKVLSDNMKLKEDQIHIEAMMEDLENQQMILKEREESIKMLEDALSTHQSESQKQVETLLIELEQTSAHSRNLEAKLEESERYETTSQQDINSLKSSLLEKDAQIETLVHELNALQQQLDNNMQQANNALEEIRQREELIKTDSEVKLLETLQQLESIRQELESTQKLCDESLQTNEQASEEISKLQTTIENLNSNIDTLSFREQELLLSISERDTTVEMLKSKIEEVGSNEAQITEQAQQKEASLSSQLEHELSNNYLLTCALEEKEKAIMTAIEQLKDLEQQLVTTTASYEKAIEEIKALKIHLKDTHEQLQTTSSNYDKSVEEIQTLSQTIQNNMQTIAHKEKEIKELYERINSYAEDNDKLKEHARVSERDLAEMTEKYQAVLSDLEKLKSSQEEAINNLKQCIALEQERNDELLQHLNSIGSTSEEEKKELLENEEMLRKEREEQINSLHELVEALKFELGENIQANTILTEELEQSNSRHSEQVDQLTVALRKQIELVDNISSEKDTMFRELNDKVVSENIELKLKETEVSNLNSELDTLREKYSELQQNYGSITHLAEESIEKLQEHEHKVQQLENQVSTLKTELDSKGEELGNSNQKLSLALKQLDLLKSSNDGASNQNATLLTTIESLELQIKTKQDEICQHLESIRLLQSGEEFVRFGEKLQIVEKKCETLVKTLQTERETLLKKESELNELRNNYDEAREQISGLEKRNLSQQMTQEENLRKLKERYSWEKKQLELSLESLTQKYSDSTSEINNLKEELDSLRKDHEKIMGHNNHKQKIQYQMKIKRENDDLKEELQRTQKELSDMKKQLNPPRQPLFGNTNFEKNVSPTEVTARDRTSFYVKRAPIQTESSLPTPLNLSQSVLAKDRPIIGRSKMLVSNITSRNFSPVDNKENVEELKTPQTATSALNTSALFGGNRKRRNIGDSNPNETSALFDSDPTESSNKKVKSTEVDEKPKFR